MMPMVLIMLKEQMDMAPNPMMTEMPEVVMDSPAQVTDSFMAALWSSPFFLSSLYLASMNMQ